MSVLVIVMFKLNVISNSRYMYVRVVNEHAVSYTCTCTCVGTVFIYIVLVHVHQHSSYVPGCH